MRDASRFSRRDGDEAFGELKRLKQLGIEIWFYQDAQQFTFGSFGENVVGFVRAEMNAEYRRQIGKVTHEAMLRNARAGHVTGGRCFGYDNVCSACRAVIPAGKVRCCPEGHTDKQINETEAAVIRRIFTLSADGLGYTRIAKRLNAEGALTPIPARGGPAAWSPSSVREVLLRPLYRGEIVYNRTRRRGADGAASYAPRPEQEWERVERKDLAIVSRDVARAAEARIATTRARLDLVTGGKLRNTRRRDSDSTYLLSGFTRCAECGGSIGVLDRRQYGCIAYHKRGTTVCTNSTKLAIAALDEAVLLKLSGEVLRPKAEKAIVEGLLAELAPRAVAKDAGRRRKELATLDLEIARLTEAIAMGGQLTSLVEALSTRTARRRTLAADMQETDVSRLDPAGLGQRVRDRFAAWRTDLAGPLPTKRKLLREILTGPLLLTPGERAYTFEGEIAAERLLTGEVGLPTNVVRPAHLRAPRYGALGPAPSRGLPTVAHVRWQV